MLNHKKLTSLIVCSLLADFIFSSSVMALPNIEDTKSNKIVPSSMSVSSETVETNIITFSYSNSDPTQLSRYDNPLTNQSVTFNYDANGNMLNDQDNHILSYDAFDNLIQVSSADGSHTNSYSYDGLGERISQTETQTGSIGQPIYFYYNQGQLSDESQINDEGLTLLSSHYVDGAQLQSGQWHYNIADARGNVISSLDSNGSISGYNTYTPFGYQKNIDPNKDTFNPLNISQLDQGYNGMITDRVTGDQFLGNGYRVYNPVLGRFMKHDSESPYGDGGINGYSYVNNDPINATDPSGHMSQVATGFITAGVGIVSFLAIGASLGALTPAAIAMDATFSTLYSAGSGALAGGSAGLAATATKDGINGDNFAKIMKNGQWASVVLSSIGGAVTGGIYSYKKSLKSNGNNLQNATSTLVTENEELSLFDQLKNNVINQYDTPENRRQMNIETVHEKSPYRSNPNYGWDEYVEGFRERLGDEIQEARGGRVRLDHKISGEIILQDIDNKSRGYIYRRNKRGGHFSLFLKSATRDGYYMIDRTEEYWRVQYQNSKPTEGVYFLPDVINEGQINNAVNNIRDLMNGNQSLREYGYSNLYGENCRGFVFAMMQDSYSNTTYAGTLYY